MKPRVLFFIEGFTDIRFVTGLSEVCDLSLMAPQQAFRSSGLKARIEESGARVSITEIPGGRLSFQLRSLLALHREVPRYDVILAQEMLRGALNANLLGKLHRVPVVNYVGISPVEYFRCRRERRRIGPLKACAGEMVIRFLMTANGSLATQTLAMGPYLVDVVSHYSGTAKEGLYYGVDTDRFRPAGDEERRALRRSHDLPEDAFLVLLSSRISHEKDPETVLKAAALARKRVKNLILLNLSGEYRDFIALARDLGIEEADSWVIGRPPAHPMKELVDFFRAADCLAMASLAEGAAFSTLESLAAGTPVVATAVGGMAVQLEGYARLSPRRDAGALAQNLQWVAANPGLAREQALRGREYVIKHWDRAKAFSDLGNILEDLSQRVASR